MDSLWVIMSPGKHFRGVPITGLNPTRVVTRATRFPSGGPCYPAELHWNPWQRCNVLTLEPSNFLEVIREYQPWNSRSAGVPIQLPPDVNQLSQAGRHQPIQDTYPKFHRYYCSTLKKPIYFSSEEVNWNNKDETEDQHAVHHLIVQLVPPLTNLPDLMNHKPTMSL